MKKKCLECENETATRQCIDCNNDTFCDSCYDKVHAKGRLASHNYEIIYVRQQDDIPPHILQHLQIQHGVNPGK